MKLITLNIWGARVREPFFDFIKNNKDVDIFCFQELYNKAEEKLGRFSPESSHNIFSEIQELLPEHDSFFRPVIGDVYGIGIFIKKRINILEEGEIIIHSNKTSAEGIIDGHHSRNLQWIKFENNGVLLSIVNVHGLWNGKGKTDTPERLEQSRKIKDFMNNINGLKVLCGDFNLRPDTKSIQIIEEGLSNLVKTHDVKSTRTSLYDKEEKFADYIFVSPEIKVNKFEVMNDEVSDHSPLFLDFQ